MWNIVKSHKFTKLKRRFLLKNARFHSIPLFILLSIVLLLFVVLYPLFVHATFKTMEKSGQFGDLYGGFNALVSGLAFIGLILSLCMQRKDLNLQRSEMRQSRIEMEEQTKQFESQTKLLKKQIELQSDQLELDKKDREEQKKESRLLEKYRIQTFYETKIDRIVTAKERLSWKTWEGDELFGHQVVVESLSYVEYVLSAYNVYFKDKRPENGERAELHFDEFIRRIKNYLPVSSQVLIFLKNIEKDNFLTPAEKNNLYNYMIFNLTPEDKQLLNLVFMRKEVANDLEYFHKDFNEGQVRRQLELQNDDISWNAINAFIASLQVMHPVTKNKQLENGDLLSSLFVTSDHPGTPQ